MGYKCIRHDFVGGCASHSGDTVQVGPGIFTTPVDKNDFGSKVLTLQGYGATGSNATILNGDHANVGVDIENGDSVSLSGFEIQNWVTGVYVSNANLTLNNSIVLGANSSTDYYGVSVLGGTAHIANSTITGTYYGVSAGGPPAATARLSSAAAIWRATRSVF